MEPLNPVLAAMYKDLLLLWFGRVQIGLQLLLLVRGNSVGDHDETI